MNGSCGELATYWECDDCVCEQNLAGCEAFDTLLFDSCVCGNAPCGSQCAASLCMDQEPDAACEACLDALDETCFEEAYTACQADTECIAYVDLSDATCGALPDE